MRIRVCITTRDRNDILARLLEGLGDGLDVYVYDDGSTIPVEAKGATVYRYFEPSGRDFWYLRVRHLLKDALKADDWDLMLWLPDDVEPVEGWRKTLLETWEGVKRADPQAVCLNPLKLAHHPVVQWVNFEPALRTAHMGDGWNRFVYQTQWMDCCGIVDRRFVREALNALRSHVPSYHEGLSTGVGRRISQLADAGGFHLYQVTETLFTHGDHASVMHPRERELNPLVT